MADIPGGAPIPINMLINDGVNESPLGDYIISVTEITNDHGIWVIERHTNKRTRLYLKKPVIWTGTSTQALLGGQYSYLQNIPIPCTFADDSIGSRNLEAILGTGLGWGNITVFGNKLNIFVVGNQSSSEITVRGLDVYGKEV